MGEDGRAELKDESLRRIDMTETIKQIIPGNNEWCMFFYTKNKKTNELGSWNWQVIPAWVLVEYVDGEETWTDVEPLINVSGGHYYNIVAACSDEYYEVSGTIVCHASEVIDTFSDEEIYKIGKDHRGLRKWLDKYENYQN